MYIDNFSKQKSQGQHSLGGKFIGNVAYFFPGKLIQKQEMFLPLLVTVS